MYKKINSKASGGIAIVSSLIAIASLSFNVIQFRENKKEKEIEITPKPSFHYWLLPNYDMLVCDYFDDNMLVNLDKMTNETEHGIKQSSFPGIKLAKNRQFDKFKEARNRICAIRELRENNAVNWQFLFVVNDVRHPIHIQTLEYETALPDTNLDITLEKGQGLLIPLGFTTVNRDSANVKDYVKPTNMTIRWLYGDNTRECVFEIPSANQRACGWRVHDASIAGIWLEPPAPPDTSE